MECCQTRRVPTINDRAALAADPKTTEATLRDLGVDKSVKVRSAVAGNPGTPVDVLEALANDVRWQVRFAVADNPNPAAIRRALSSRYSDVRGLASQRDDLDSDTRRQVLQDPDFRVRMAMAEGCSDPETLTTLARDEHPLVRSCAVLNRRLPAAVVEESAGDRRAEVRAAVAVSGRARPETLIRLARDRSAVVRWKLLVDNSDRRDLLEILVQDRDELIARHARDYLAELEQSSDDRRAGPEPNLLMRLRQGYQRHAADDRTPR